MKLPAHAPDWAQPLVLSLLDAGFAETDESIGSMNSYLVSLRLDDLTVALVADRGQWWIQVQAPNPAPGRGRPGVVNAAIEVYMAALRHDVTPDAFFEDLATRAEKGAAWLEEDLELLLQTYRDAQVWRDVQALQRARAERLFGPAKGQG